LHLLLLAGLPAHYQRPKVLTNSAHPCHGRRRRL
jgi:hypothetical protein